MLLLCFLLFQNQTRGLFGNWSLDMNDDFTRPDGTVQPIDLNNFQSAHRDFAQHCKYPKRKEKHPKMLLLK